MSGIFRLVDRVDVADERWKRQSRAYVMGGMIATDMALTHLPKLAAYWRDTDVQFIHFMRIFSLHMISCWGNASAGTSWAHCENCAKANLGTDDIQQMLEDSAGDLINLLGGNEALELPQWRVLDAIFKDDLDHDWPRFPEFVMSVAAERLGRRLPMSLDRISLPVESFTQLVESGWRTMLDPHEAVAAALALSPQPMLDWQQQNAA